MERNPVRLAALIWAGVGALGGGFLVGFGLRHEPAVAAQVPVGPPGTGKVKPFIAKRREAHYPPKGDPMVTVRTMVRRSDGSMVDRYEALSPKGEFGYVMEGDDLQRGEAFGTEPFTQSITTFYLSDREIRQRIGDRDRCADPGIRASVSAAARGGASPSAILGLPVARVDTQTSRFTSAEWVAPALGCFALRETQSEPGGSHNELEVIELSAAEPPDAEFAPPEGLVERSPAEVEAAYTARYGKPLFGERMASTLEERYRNHLANRRN